MTRWTHHCGWLSTLAISAVASIAVGAPSTPNACSAYDEELNSTTPNVVYDDPQFVYKETQFPVHVFSLSGVPPWTTNFICLRYELENTGNNTIPLVFWNLINEWSALDLPAHKRLTRVRRRPSASKNAVQAPTVIKAFRSEEISTVAWQWMEDWLATLKKSGMTEPVPNTHFERSATLDPAAKKAIEAGEIPDTEVAVIEPPGDAVATPPIVSDTLIASFGEFDTVSGVSVYNFTKERDPRQPRYAVYTSITIKPSANTRIEAFAPALVGIEKYADNIQGYLQALHDSSGSLGEISDKSVYTASAPIKAASERVFIVEHPISVHWFDPAGRHSTCVTVASYSPFPINLDQKYCIR